MAKEFDNINGEFFGRDNMNNELNFLNVNNKNYEISDKKARDDISKIKVKQVVSDVSLTSNYANETKTLTLSLNVTKGAILNGYRI